MTARRMIPLRKRSFTLPLTMAGLALALFLSACDGSTGLTAKEYLKRAENHWSNNELNAAVIELKTA